MTTVNKNFEFLTFPTGKTVTIRILPEPDAQPLFFTKQEPLNSFDPIDWPVAQERFNKLRGFFYTNSQNAFRREGKDSYSYTADGVVLGMTFGSSGFVLHIGEDRFDFETVTNWVYSDVGIVGADFPIFEEMMEFVADYYLL